MQAVHNVSESTDNDKIINFLEQQDQEQVQNLRKNISDRPDSIEMEARMPEAGELSAKKVEKLTDIAEIHVLDQIDKHIEEQVKKFGECKKGEWIEFSYQNLYDIIDKVPGKEK